MPYKKNPIPEGEEHRVKGRVNEAKTPPPPDTPNAHHPHCPAPHPTIPPTPFAQTRLVSIFLVLDRSIHAGPLSNPKCLPFSAVLPDLGT